MPDTATPTHSDALFKKYDSNLKQLGAALSKSDVDYILALSRTGPRLLELLQQEGLLNVDCPIITEKALQFMPDHEIDGSSIIVFDDIIISGTTVLSILCEIFEGYNVKGKDLQVVTLAVDKENKASAAYKQSESYIKLPQEIDGPETVSWSFFISLPTAERYTFCKEVVFSLCRLNKPYDIDFALLHTNIRRENISSLEKIETFYDITTVKQRQHDLERYTILLEGELLRPFFDKVFAADLDRSQLNKVRLYYNRRKGEGVFAPMTVFGLEKEILKDGDIFVDELDAFNLLIEDARNRLLGDTETREKDLKAIYRLTWFLSSYLFGLYFKEIFSRDLPNHLTSALPYQMFNKRDLSFIFGPQFSSTIIEELDLTFRTVRSFISDISPEFTAGQYDLDTVEMQYPDQFRPESLYFDIKDGVETNLTESLSMGSKLAVIFEQLYLNKELDAQREARRIDDEGNITKLLNLAGRLRSGFTFEQLLGILKSNITFERPDYQIRREASLAVDFLVDKGVQIPEFVVSNGIIRRAYRNGETANILHQDYLQIMGQVLERALSDPTSSTQEIVSNVHLEKLGVLSWERLSEDKKIDALERPPSEGMEISTEFNLYGKTMVTETESDDSSSLAYDRWSGNMFVDWAEENKIVTPLDPLKTRYKYITKWTIEESDYRRAVEGEYLERLGAYAKLLHAIQSEFEDKDYLITISSCSDHEKLIKSLKAELRLLFESVEQKYMLSTKLNNLSKTTKPSTTNSGKCETRRVINQINGKRELWDTRKEMVGNVKEFLSNSRTVKRSEDIEAVGWAVENLKGEMTNIDNIPDKPAEIGELRSAFDITISMVELACSLYNLLEQIEKLQNASSENNDEPAVSWNELVTEWNNDSKEKWQIITGNLDERDEEYSIVPFPKIEFACRNGRGEETVVETDTAVLQLDETHEALSELYKEYVYFVDHILDEYEGNTPTQRDGIDSEVKWVVDWTITGEGESVPDSVTRALQEIDHRMWGTFIYAETVEELNKKVGKAIYIAEQRELSITLGICAVNDTNGSTLKVSEQTSMPISTEPMELAASLASTSDSNATVVNDDVDELSTRANDASDSPSHRLVVTHGVVTSAWEDLFPEEPNPTHGQADVGPADRWSEILSYVLDGDVSVTTVIDNKHVSSSRNDVWIHEVTFGSRLTKASHYF